MTDTTPALATIHDTKTPSDLALVGKFPQLPGYEILEELGRGGMGVVYLARQLTLNRLVAIKMVLGGGSAGAEQLARFQAEGQAVAALQHPNIVQIHEVGQHDSLPYFSLEFVDGGSLDKTLKGQPQPPLAAAKLTETLARAMQRAHDQSIVHRDLKPANILLTQDGTPKITDFGLAKQLNSDSTHTKSGVLLGTPSYVAPEQARGDVKEVGPAADIYSLGAILYELMVGRPPFLGTTYLDTVMQVLRDDPVAPTRLVPQIPIDLETICLKCLQKDPARRYRSADELAEDCRRFQLGEPILSRPISQLERMVSWSRRNPRMASLIATVVALLVLVVVGSLAAAYMINGERQEALLAQRTAETAEQTARKAEEAAKLSEQAAISSAEEAKRNAAAALKQSQLSLTTLQLLVDKVQRQLDQVPGMQDLKKSLLQTAVEGLDKVAANYENSPSVEATRLAAHYQMGNLFRQMGASLQAVREFERAYEVAQRRADAEPQNAASQENLTLVLLTLGDVELDLSRNLSAASLHYREAQRILEALQQRPPEQLANVNPLVTRQRLAEVHMRIGTTHLRLGVPAKALESYQRALELRQAILAQEPDAAAWKVNVANSHQALAEVQLSLANTDQAQQEYQRALGLVEGVAKAHPDAPVIREQLANMTGDYGDLCLRLRQLDQAEDYLRRSHKLQSELAAEDTTNIDRQGSLALSHYRLGVLAEIRGDGAASAVALAECLAIRRQNVALDDSHKSRVMELMLVLARVGETDEADGIAKGLLENSGDDREVLINVARAWTQCSRSEKADEARRERFVRQAIAAIQSAVEHGYRDRMAVQTEPDLAALEKQPEFVRLLDQLREPPPTK
jgi:serine/threonine protein kinase/tetratricopeptide (TPR) repeat protein